MPVDPVEKNDKHLLKVIEQVCEFVKTFKNLVFLWYWSFSLTHIWISHLSVPPSQISFRITATDVDADAKEPFKYRHATQLDNSDFGISDNH